MADASDWVLDLSSNPPKIYNSQGTENLHNAFQPPYPKAFWFVNQDGDNVTHDGELTYHSPALDTPYPLAFWFVNQDGDDVMHDGELTYHSPALDIPYPYIFWFVNQDGDDLLHYALYDYEHMGACYRCTNLTNMTIPKSVKNIGPNMATNSQLTSVTIASDCEYESTSFPVNCTVNFYQT